MRMRMMMEDLPDFRDVEHKLGRKVPESLVRSLAGDPFRGSETHARADGLQTLHNNISFLRQQMAHLRAIDVTLMHQLLSINEGIESIRWVMEERGGGASREGSVTDSLCSLSDGAESERGSCSDGLDGISLGSYLDTLGEDEPERSSPADLSRTSMDEETLTKSPLRPRVETDEYYCFG
ncbi:leucine rich adaptor protein 1-like [Sinocyclocheilus grahami]|uniref:leucine rich adaptor protein 1-like n=1 Tax=Sinocyclocheilus grahami TaxID=75366 RepID=UPI0007AD0433|nr:PREDICTED: leucine rich adaptor protein 1-like [Sinocyclocheilus grahami]